MRRLLLAVALAPLLVTACAREPTTIIVEVRVQRSLCVADGPCQRVPIADADIRVLLNGEPAASLQTDPAGFATTAVRQVGLVRVEVDSPFLSQQLSMEQAYTGGEVDLRFFDPEPVRLAAPRS